MDRGAWQATVRRVPKDWTQLKWLSMHTSMNHRIRFSTFLRRTIRILMGDDIESVDLFGLYYHFNSSKTSSSWTQECLSLGLLRFLLSMLCNFQGTSVWPLQHLFFHWFCEWNCLFDFLLRLFIVSVKGNWFSCVLILYPEILLYLFISSSKLLCVWIFRIFYI